MRCPLSVRDMDGWYEYIERYVAGGGRALHVVWVPVEPYKKHLEKQGVTYARRLMGDEEVIAFVVKPGHVGADGIVGLRNWYCLLDPEDPDDPEILLDRFFRGEHAVVDLDELLGE